MHQRKRVLLLALLALVMAAARASVSRKVTVNPSENGVVEANVSEASEGQRVTLTVFPAEGYRLSGIYLLLEPISPPENSESGTLTRYALPAIGGSVDAIPTTENTYSFLMPAHDVEISGRFCKVLAVEGINVTTANNAQLLEEKAEVVVTVCDEARREVTLEQIRLQNVLQNGVTVHIPPSVKDAEGNAYNITAISPYAFLGQENVSDVWLPDTEQALVIGKNAFLLEIPSESNRRMPTLHVPLSLLDDYALMRTLEDLYEESRIHSSVEVPNRYWTFSCGVDVYVPEEVVFYTLSECNGYEVKITRQDSMSNKRSGKNVRVIKANNGVLLDGMRARKYEIIACPSDDRPSGMIPPLHNAMSYEGINLLEPVVEARHFDSGEYYVLSHNEFRPIFQEEDSAKVPACKAVLHLKGKATRSLVIHKNSKEEEM